VTAIQALLLGIIQGLTEFLPISSTAHLTIAGRLLGVVNEETSEGWTAFIAVIQLGTLVAVVLYFFRDIAGMGVSAVRDLLHRGSGDKRRTISPSTRLALLIVAGTIPIGLVGVLLSDVLHGLLTKNLVVISSSLIVLALFLWWAEKRARHIREVSDLDLKDSLLIGGAQCLALIPGSSRSGTTITAGLFLNLTRQAAARFSFLLSIPAVLASGLHEMFSLTADPLQFGLANLVIATAASAASGYASIAWLLRFLTKRSTMVFVVYRLALGLILIACLMSGILQP
jgi:undecaprenyl-diphosphatase